jgi:hypothetical protein
LEIPVGELAEFLWRDAVDGIFVAFEFRVWVGVVLEELVLLDIVAVAVAPEQAVDDGLPVYIGVTQ